MEAPSTFQFNLKRFINLGESIDKVNLEKDEQAQSIPSPFFDKIYSTTKSTCQHKTSCDDYFKKVN